MYKDELIHVGNLINFNAFIPENYRAQIRKKELAAIATYDGTSQDALVGVSVTAVHAGWLELVWLAMGEDYRQDMQAADYLRYVLRREKRTGQYVGAFCELHEGEDTRMHRDILTLAGMEIKTAKNNIYELALSEVEHTDMLFAAANNADCRFFSEIAEDLFELAEEKIYEDERVVPMPTYLDSEEYSQELSVMALEDGVPVGVLLLSEAKDYLSIELCYSASVKAMPAMIGTALKKARKLYPPDKRVMMSIVGRRAAELIEKLVPRAVRGEITEAVLWFEAGKTKKKAQIVQKLLRGNAYEAYMDR